MSRDKVDSWVAEGRVRKMKDGERFVRFCLNDIEDIYAERG